MHARVGWLAVLGLVGGVGGAALAQQTPPPARTPDRVTRETREMADDVAIARALTVARFSREQLERLLPVLDEGFQQLDAGDKSAMEEIGNLREALAAAKKAVLGGQETPPGAEQQYALTVQRLISGRDDYRREFRDRVRALLMEIVPEGQRPDLINAARPAVVARRLGELEPALQPFWTDRGGIGGGFRFGGGGFGRGGRGAERDLDRLRSAPPEEYDRVRLRFALSSANIPGWWAMPGMFGAGRGPGGGAGGGNGRGPRATIFGPGGQQIEPPNLNDPAVQARLRPYLQLADRVRALPPQQYEQQKARLAAQLDAAERQARREQEARREISFDEALNAFVDAYLLNPRAPGVIKVRLGKA